jgi:pimeloyl-ACP methyl ester carboxylesterase
VSEVGPVRVGDLIVERWRPSGPPRALPLLFIHGVGGGSWYFENYLRAASEAGWGCWAVNLRGHHGSRPVADLGRVSVADYVQDARDVLEAVGPAAIVGHSMGGLVAQCAAASHPHARAAVFLTSAAPRGILALSGPSLARAWHYLGPILRNRPLRAWEADNVALILNRMTPAQRAAALRRFVPESGRATRELALGCIAVDEAQVRCPTLVVGATDDRILPPSIQRRIARKYGSAYQEARDHGHMLMLEDGWEVPFAAVLAWLAARDGGGAAP